jgi:hypothetical protein
MAAMTIECDAVNTPLARALARRERHRARPIALRALPLVAVAVLLATSVEVYLRVGFLPPLVLPAVVALLALEFHWAARLLAWGIGRVTRLIRRVRRR